MAPQKTRALILNKTDPVNGKTYHSAALEERPIPALEAGQVLVRIGAAGFNRRDLWQRMGMYPGIQFGTVMGSDGAGVVVEAHDPKDPLLGSRVFLTVVRGWENELAPTTPSGLPTILGAGGANPEGVFTEYVVVDRREVLPTPAHLNDVQAAAWPLGGVTAWRACVVNAQIRPGENVLITGIGGGVALLAAQLCVASGARVFVTSGSEEKILRAVALGVVGGVSYKSKEWPLELGKLLKSKGDGRPYLDAVIDSGGSEILSQTTKLLKPGGKLVCYGMTAGPKVTLTMREVLRNQQLLGSTMGSRQDLIDATAFTTEHKIVPLVSNVLSGLDAIEEGFEILKTGDQFGKIVVRIGPDSLNQDNARPANL